MCKACGCGKTEGQRGFSKGKMMAKKGFHKMPDGMMMKNSSMRKGKK
jgi:hypothetical protein